MLHRVRLICALAILAACSDPPAPGTEIPETPARPPTAALISSSIAQPAGSDTEGVVGYTYVSMVPGTEWDGWYAEVRNRRGGASARAPIGDGGFDPVAVAAVAGDTLSITVVHWGGHGTTTYGVVPISSRPSVVRTSPVSGKTDVPLDSVILVVFNQPMDSASLPKAVRLLQQGVDVPGTVRGGPTGGSILRGEFVPPSPLMPLSTYELSVSTEAQTPDGVSLGAPLTVEFRTRPSNARRFSVLQLGPAEVHLPATAPGNAVRLRMTAFDQYGVEIPVSTAASFSSSAAEVARVSTEGVVTGVAPGTAEVSATLTLDSVTRTASVIVTTHAPDARTGQYSNFIGIWDLIGVVTASDPAFPIPNGTLEDFVLIVQSAAVNRFTGTYTAFLSIHPADSLAGVPLGTGTVVGSIGPSGEIVIELFREGSQSSNWFGHGSLSSGLIQGQYSAGVGRRGTFTATPRLPE